MNLAATDYPDLADFGHDPWWLVLIKAVAVFAFLVANPLVAILAERKIMQVTVARRGRTPQVLPAPRRCGNLGW